jgi:hypothetical protein
MPLRLMLWCRRLVPLLYPQQSDFTAKNSVPFLQHTKIAISQAGAAQCVLVLTHYALMIFSEIISVTFRSRHFGAL